MEIPKIDITVSTYNEDKRIFITIEGADKSIGGTKPGSEDITPGMAKDGYLFRPKDIQDQIDIAFRKGYKQAQDDIREALGIE